MEDVLRFNPDKYEVKTCEEDGRSITYRAFEGLEYCTAPIDPVQKLNIFVPEAYYQGEDINGYDLHSAPIFAPNTVGGYLPGLADTPGRDYRGEINSVFAALEHGYVVVSAGIRGRTSGKKSGEFFVGGKADHDGTDTGRFVGKAPALIVDMKAVIRYLRHNRETIPGSIEHIITSGTSAGGALSAMVGASGNSSDYESYLKEIGAAEERDDIFAANCYCPIHNLENADAAYEWLFCGHRYYHRKKFTIIDGRVQWMTEEGEMSDLQMEMSEELKRLFPTYLNSLQLTDQEGNTLTLDADGNGNFKEYVCRFILESAQRELDTHDSAERLHKLAVSGSAVEEQSCLTIENGRAVAVDWDAFVGTITRMKTVPAFDALDLQSPENEELGTEETPAQHFTAFSKEHSQVDGGMADVQIIKLLNPTVYIGEADTAKHWRIRHGAFDRDTSLAIPVILATMLKNKGYSVDFRLPWGLPHSGDYDLEELFEWIDGICK